MGRYGLLTEKQYLILKLRLEGKTQKEIAELIRTSRENVSIIEKRALRKVKLAEETLKAYKELTCVSKFSIPSGTHLAKIPSIVIDAASKAGVKLRGNYALIYESIRFNARDCVEGTVLVKPVEVRIFRDGSFEINSLQKTEE